MKCSVTLNVLVTVMPTLRLSFRCSQFGTECVSAMSRPMSSAHCCQYENECELEMTTVMLSVHCSVSESDLVSAAESMFLKLFGPPTQNVGLVKQINSAKMFAGSIVSALVNVSLLVMAIVSHYLMLQSSRCE